MVPVHIDGTWHVLPKGGGRMKRSATTVTFGTPLWPDEDEDSRRFAPRIEAAIATLANETTTDWWTARKRAAAGTTPALQGPDASPWRRAWALPPSPTDRAAVPLVDDALFPADAGEVGSRSDDGRTARPAWPRWPRTGQ